MAIFNTTLSDIFQSLGLDEAGLVERVKQHEDEVRKSNAEHAAVMGKLPPKDGDPRDAVVLTAAQIETVCRDFLPFNLQGLAAFMAPGVIEAVGEDAGHGEVPGVAVHSG